MASGSLAGLEETLLELAQRLLGCVPPRTIEEVVEPYLLQQGFIQRTPRGRLAMPLCFSHLGVPHQPNMI